MEYSSLVLQNADNNFYYTSHLFAKFAVKGAADHSLGSGMSQCGMSIYQFNNAFPGKEVTQLKEFAEAANQFFGSKPFEYQLILPETQQQEVSQTLEQAGLKFDGRIPAMILSIDNLIPPKPSDHPLTILQVTTAEQLKEYLQVCAASYSFPEFVGDRIFTQRYLEDSAVTLYLGYDQGEPAAASMRVEDPDLKGQSDSLAGIYWVGTKPEFRKRGHGERLTHYACEQAREDGYALVSLQASEMGEPIYKRMGFETTAYYQRYVKQWSK